MADTPEAVAREVAERVIRNYYRAKGWHAAIPSAIRALAGSTKEGE